MSKGIKRLLEEGADSDSFTISSDGQGSLPLFDEHGQFLESAWVSPVPFIKEVRECTERENIPLETAIKAITANPARVLGLQKKAG